MLVQNYSPLLTLFESRYTVNDEPVKVSALAYNENTPKICSHLSYPFLCAWNFRRVLCSGELILCSGELNFTFPIKQDCISDKIISRKD